MLTFKNKKETEKEYGHTEVYFYNEYLGYIIKNNSTSALKDENWNFCSKNDKINFFYAKNKKKLIQSLENKLKIN